MARHKVLDYDPSRYLKDSSVVLREITYYDSEGTKVLSLYVPLSKITNKSDEEISRYITRLLLAFNLDVSKAVPTIERSPNTKSSIANHLARTYTVNLMVQLMGVYAARLSRGDGNDPEIKMGVPATEEENAALDRIISHLCSRIEPKMTKLLAEYPDFITEVWRTYLRNIAGKTILLIRDEKGDDYAITEEEFMSVSDRHWKWVYTQTIETTAEKMIISCLHRLKPSSMPFSDLQAILRNGLEVSLAIIPSELCGVAEEIKNRVGNEKNLVLKMSGDARELRIILPEESNLSQSDIMKFISKINQNARNNVKIADWPIERLEKLGAEYVILKDSLKRVKKDAKKYHLKNPSQWRLHMQIDYSVLRDHPDILDKMGQAYFGYGSDVNATIYTLEPNDIAWEIAARRSWPEYKPFSAKAETFSKHAILPVNSDSSGFKS